MASDKFSNSLGNRLLAALTNAEVGSLLDSLLQNLTPENLEQSLTQLSADTQATVRQILHPPTTLEPSQSPESSPISQAKLSQTWSELWQEWEAIIWEASDEEGQYIEQEAHWEPPYFDNYTFAEDLDKVAEKMQPLIQVAFENGFTPDRGFAPALLEAEAVICGGIPDWMEIADGIELGNHVTQCLLRWEFLTAQQQGQDAFQFAQHIKQLESEFSLMGLDEQVLIDFLCELPETDRQRIFAGLTDTKDSHSPPWQRELSNAHSPWHLFYREATTQFAPERYLDNLRTTIAQRWTDGLPVIENLLAEKNYSESLAVIQETLTSLFASRYRKADWTPESSLLVTLVGGYYYQEEFCDNEKTLLGYFQQAAQALGNTEQANALKIQQTAFDSYFDWQTMFQAFAEVPVSQKTRQALFQSWRDSVIQRATPQSSFFGSRQESQNGWLHWLIDSIADTSKGAPWYQQQITQWLIHLPGNRDTLGDSFGLLRLLTKDLYVLEGEKRSSYPMFYEVVIRVGELSAPDDSSRQAYLKAFAPKDLWEHVMAYWKAHLQNFVPDPRSAHKSDYTQHARWMTALKEFAPDAYEVLLAQWERDHIRRSNLWKAMKQAGLAGY
jgi:hypothetical protein